MTLPRRNLYKQPAVILVLVRALAPWETPGEIQCEVKVDSVRSSVTNPIPATNPLKD